jgi:hypothetical protein
LAKPTTAEAGQTQIQSIPTPWIYVGGRSSYDSFEEYQDGVALAGLFLGNNSHLGANWPKRASLYAEGVVFGVIAFDTYQIYNPGATLDGLNGPFGWNGPYVEPGAIHACGTNVPPGINPITVVTPGTLFEPSEPPLDSGTNQYGFLFMANHDMLVTGLGRFINATSTRLDAIMVIQGTNDTIYATCPIYTTNNNQWTYGCLSAGNGASNYVQLVKGNNYMVFCYEGIHPLFTAPVMSNDTVVSSSAVITVRGSVTINGGPNFGGSTIILNTNQMFGPYGFLYDMGLLWSNNVVRNGGANPSTGTVTNLDNFWNGLVAAGLDGGTRDNKGSFTINTFAPDNLIASITPFVYYLGANPWQNNGPFVSGDLTVNGLIGNGGAKFLAPVLTGSMFTNLATSVAWYPYTETVLGSQVDYGTVQAAQGQLLGVNTIFRNGQSTANDIVPGSPQGNGFYADNRTSGTDHKAYFANSGNAFAQTGGTDSTLYNVAMSANPFIVFGYSDGVPHLTTTSRLSYFSVHHNFTATDLSNEFNLVQTLRTALGGGFR